MSDLKLESVEQWAPHPAAAPKTSKTDSGSFLIAANGTRTCVGGWQFSYTGLRGGEAYRVEFEVDHDDVADTRDTLRCISFWGHMPAGQVRVLKERVLKWENLLPRPTDEKSLVFSRRLVAPEGAPSRSEVLARLARGEISAGEAEEKLRRR